MEQADSQDHGDTYPELDENHAPSLLWMEGYQPVPVGAFLLTAGPVVHEGFIPDDADHNARHYGASDNVTSDFNMRNPYIPLQQPQSDLHAYHRLEVDADFSPRHEGSGNDENEASSDGDELAEEVDVQTGDGIYAGTRLRTSGRPSRLWAAPTRGRGASRASSRGQARENAAGVGRGRGVGRPRGRGRGRGRGGGPRNGAGWNAGIKTGPRAPKEPSKEFLTLQQQAISSFIDEQNHEKAMDLILQAIAINPEVYTAHVLLSEIYFGMGEEEKALAALFSGAHASPRDPHVWQQVADACLRKTSLDRVRTLEQAVYCFARLVEIDPKDQDARFQRAVINRELGCWGKAMKDLDQILQEMPHNPSVIRQIAEICLEIHQVGKAKELYEACFEYHRETGLNVDDSLSWADIKAYVELFAYEGSYEEAISKLKRLSRWLLGREEEAFWDEVVEDDREFDADDQPRRDETASYQPGKFPLEAYGDGLPLEIRNKLGSYRLKQDRKYRDEAIGHFEWLEPEDPDSEANVPEYSDLFREAATALREAKEYSEALRYYEPLKQIKAFSDTELWLGIASSSYICGRKAQALECYEAAKASDDQCAEARMQLAKLYKELGDREQALANAHEALELARQGIRYTQHRKYEKREQRLARQAAEKVLRAATKIPIESIAKNPRRAWRAQKQAYDRQSQVDQQRGDEIRQRKDDQRRKLNPASGQDLEDRRANKIQQLHNTLIELSPAMREGDPSAQLIWTDCAGELVADFRANKVFYPYERHMQFRGYDSNAKQEALQRKWIKEAMKINAETTHEASPSTPSQDIPMPSIETPTPTDYHGISFKSWLDLFLEYSLVLAKKGEDYKDQCYSNLNAASDCVIYYHEPDSMLQIYVCYFTCALALNDASTLVNVAARWFMRQYSFCTDAYRLFAALNLVYRWPNVKGGRNQQMQDAPFRLGPSQKFLMRQIHRIDSQLPEDYGKDTKYGPVPQFMRDSLGEGAKEGRADEVDETKRAFGKFPGLNERVLKPVEMDVVLLTIYGHILYCGGSYPNAMSYFFRAYSLDPKNPMILLSLGLSYIHQLFKRQNENRHMYFLQGLAFMEEYADMRIEQARQRGGEEEERQARLEVEFNKARVWQMCGMGDLALNGYARVIEGGTTQSGHHEGDTNYSTQSKEDYSMEAAYAMQTIYGLSGNSEMAKEVTEKWLVVE